MPLYVYRCDSCNHGTEEFQHIKDQPLTECPECGLSVYHRVPTVPHTDMQEFAEPIHMHSIGLCHDDDIKAFKQRNPGVQISEDPNDPLHGVPIAKSRKEKLSILKIEGWEERN